MKHLSVFRRWAATATAIASLPAGSSQEDVRQLLDEYFQRSDFAQMWAVSLDKQAISSQRLRRAERLFRRVQQPIYKDDRFHVYVPVRVNPEQPVTGTVPGVVKVEQGGGLSAGLLLRHAHGCRRAAPVSASGSALSVHLPLFCPAFCVAKRGKIL